MPGEPDGEVAAAGLEAENTATAAGMSSGTAEFDFGRRAVLASYQLPAGNGRRNRFQNYSRGCKWSPDGLCLLLCSNDNKLRVLEAEGGGPADADTAGVEMGMKAAVEVQESGPVYDFGWFPGTDSSDPDTCCFASTAQDQPIHLYDGYTGDLRASYRCYNQYDEVSAARSVAFCPSGQWLYAGRRGEIHLFRTDRPGRQLETLAGPSGKAGIVSAVAASPALRSVYAVGTYSRRVAVYSRDQKGPPLSVLEGQKAGVTGLAFSPDGLKLAVGGRKGDDEILLWDIRTVGGGGGGGGTSASGGRGRCRPLVVLKRKVETNQRIHFDISSGGRYLASGNTDGSLRVWDIISGGTSGEDDCGDGGGSAGEVMEPIADAVLHSDSLNGVAIHPYMPFVASSSGQRHLAARTSWSSSSSSEDSEEDRPSSARRTVVHHCDFSVKVWNFSKVATVL